jgi:glutamate dehydrogenase/leucine dehydrogenase
MGADELAMGWIKDEIGRAVGLPREIGGIPLHEIGATGFGLVAAIDVTREQIGLSLTGARVAVQGFGSVGQHAARFLAEKESVLVAASDTHGTIADQGGLDLPALIALKAEGRALHNHPRGRKLGMEAAIDVPCDTGSPLAQSDVIHGDNVARLQTRLVAEGANIPLSVEAEQVLASRSVLVLPDFHGQCGRCDLCRGRISRRDRGGCPCVYRREDPRQHQGRSRRSAARRGVAAHCGDIAGRERVHRAMRTRRWDAPPG